MTFLYFLVLVLFVALFLPLEAVSQVEYTTAPREPLIQGMKYEPQVFDLRYAPERWQGAICLPDDPHKTIVGSDGALYYDFGGGRFHSFRCRVQAALEGSAGLERLDQKLYDPRVPIVLTRFRAGDLQLSSEAWAAAPDEEGVERWKETRHDYFLVTVKNTGTGDAEARPLLRVDPSTALVLAQGRRCLVERLHPERVFCALWPRPESMNPQEEGRLKAATEAGILRDWAKPEVPCDPRFRHILVGWNSPLVFLFRAEPGKKYVAVFGLIEGHHQQEGVRPLRIVIEGKTVRRVDPVLEMGWNRPMVLAFDGKDENGDGFLELAVHAANDEFDRNTVLSALWIFEEGEAPDMEALLAGGADGKALAVVDADHPGTIPPAVLRFPVRLLAPGEEYRVLAAIPRGERAKPRAASVQDGEMERDRAVKYWKNLDLPYDRIRIPDAGMQGLLDSCIRNIYQAREVRNGRPAFQVGPTHYRGMWAADGPFILEAITYLGRAAETRPGLELLSEGDEGPQGIEFSKKSGLRLWMIRRHAQLTGDREWLEMMWPKVKGEVERIREYRAVTLEDPGAANYGLMPIGFGDGGLGGKHREYTNVYWNLSGLRSALQVAKKLGKTEEEASWRMEYADFLKAFDRARERDKLTDAFGNTYVPVTMKGEEPQLPQRGAWSFLQSVYPGRIFDVEKDPLMLGTMAMLTAVEREGLIFGTGWLADGIWNYAASFYGHAHLWLGHGKKGASTLYAFANHACPLLCWREEQNVKGEAERYVGDMPHNWASGEFIRMVRHLLILERGRELHLLEGLPRAWTRPGDETRLKGIPTSFGEMNMTLRIERDGKTAVLRVDPPAREAPLKTVVHLEGFEQPVKGVETEALPGGGFAMKVSLDE